MIMAYRYENPSQNENIMKTMRHSVLNVYFLGSIHLPPQSNLCAMCLHPFMLARSDSVKIDVFWMIIHACQMSI